MDARTPESAVGATAHLAASNDSASRSTAKHAGAALGATLVLLALFPLTKSVMRGGTAGHIGIAPAAPVITSYGIVIAGAALYAAWLRFTGRGQQVLPPLLVVFSVLLCAYLAVVWSGTREQLSGSLQLLYGIAALAAGSFLGRRALSSEGGARWVAIAILTVVTVEAGVCVAQRAGVPINPMSEKTLLAMGDRVNGTQAHPNNLGKVIVLMVVLSLGLMSSPNRRTRQVLWLAVGLSTIPLAMSEGRANALAAASVLIIWALFPRPSNTRKSYAARIAIPLTLTVVGAIAIGPFIARMQADPEGGDRDHLAAVGIQQIELRPFSGTGPNSYVEVVSAYDPIVAAGYPVHNTFYLSAAELGLPLALMLWLPLGGIVIRAAKSTRKSGYAGSLSIALIAAMPGLLVTMVTGWAWLSNAMWPLLMLLLGITFSQIMKSPSQKAYSRPSSSPSTGERLLRRALFLPAFE